MKVCATLSFFLGIFISSSAFAGKLRCTDLMLGPFYSHRNLSSERLARFLNKDIDGSDTPPAGVVALTFDDGPHPEFTLQIADVLERYGVKAVFFQIGKEAEKYPEISSELIRRGHVVGSHSWDHPNFQNLETDVGIQNLAKGHEAVTKATEGKASRLFRYPYGSRSDRFNKTLETLDLLAVEWNINTGDYHDKTPEKLLEQTKSYLLHEGWKRGGVILFHDVQEKTVKMLDQFLQFLVDENFEVVTLRYE